MRTIDIRTTQNVTISYELAHARDRIIAFILDWLLKFAVIGIGFWIFSGLISGSNSDVAEKVYLYLFNIPIVMFTMLVMEIQMNGQTIGKKAMKIKVVKLDGKQPGFYDYLLRWVFRLIDVYSSMGIAGTMLVASSEFSQRIGDMVSNTTVVKVNNTQPITLSDILKIDDRFNYIPAYPAVRNFMEDDIVLIKQTLDRYRQYRNHAHRDAIDRLCNKMKEQLGLEDIPADKQRFLKTIIKDYIVLTR